ncbi:hypothetical protein TNCV_2901621 [Trichonephila clavipes]|nr:hypothetical protein TNCV_2901621 [Trichonephila clavipes]
MSNEKHFSIASESSFRAWAQKSTGPSHWSIEIYNQKFGLSSAYPGPLCYPFRQRFLCPVKTGTAFQYHRPVASPFQTTSNE